MLETNLSWLAGRWLARGLARNRTIDLSAKIKVKADELVSKTLVSSEVSKDKAEANKLANKDSAISERLAIDAGDLVRKSEVRSRYAAKGCC